MRKTVYTGRGIAQMLKVSKKHGLTSLNSALSVANPDDLNSKWTITVKTLD